MHYTRFSFIPLLAIVVLVFIGCSGGGGPITAPDTEKPAAIDISDSIMPDGRIFWGAWTFGIDPVKGTVDVMPKRGSSFHIDVSPFLFPPNCGNCLTVQLTGIVDTNTYSIDVTLKNPTAVTGYDVRGTIFETGIIKLKNADSYTLILAPGGDISPNGFIAFDTGIGQREFPGGNSQKETFHIFNLFHPDYSTVDFVVDASWPGNCKEPYEVNTIVVTGSFKDDGSNTADIFVDVHDWQNDVEEVIIDLSSLGGAGLTQMTFGSGVTWFVQNVSWQSGGMPAGEYNALITARTTGAQAKRETYNYAKLVISSGGGPGVFSNELANKLLEGEDAPGTCLDLAVIGDDLGASYTLVIASDNQYHTWDVIYDPENSGGYVGNTPFDPKMRFDNASLLDPGNVFTWVWVEVNDDPDLYDPFGDPPFDTPSGWWTWIYYWDAVPDPKITGWIFYENPDDIMPPETYIEPFDAFGGFQRDGMQYWASRYVSGDDTLYPYIGLYGFGAPYNDPAEWTFGYAPEGSGDGLVDTTLVHSADVDDYAGYDEMYAVFAEGAPANAIEIFQYDWIDAQNTQDFNMVSHLTIHPTSEPIDVEILPMKNLAMDSNWICVLTSANEVEVYKISDGSLVTTFGDSGTISGTARFLDVDDLNYKVHIMQDGPMVSVFFYDP